MTGFICHTLLLLAVSVSEFTKAEVDKEPSVGAADTVPGDVEELFESVREVASVDSLLTFKERWAALVAALKGIPTRKHKTRT